MPKLTVNGTELHYEEAGRGAETIVFSHGLLWSGRMFDGQVKALAERYRCIAYDHRGQGQSATSAVPYDLELLTDDAVALIDRLGAAPCHFVGLSMGGFVGLRLALRRPELLRSLVLVDSAADGEPRWNPSRYRAMLLVMRLLGTRVLLGAIGKIMFGRPFRTDPARAEELRAMEAQLLALPPDRTGAALAAVISRRSLEADLHRVNTPTLVLEGAEDAAVIPARARRTAEAIKGARYVEIPGAGHTSSVEEPAAVTAALESFFSGLP